MPATRTSDRLWLRLSWLWLALLAPTLVFSNGRWQMGVAALASAFLARLFLFSQPVVRGLLIFLAVQVGAYLIMWREVIPAPGVLYYLIAAAYALCYYLPFVVDRLAGQRSEGFAGTLVLPLAWYLVEIIIHAFAPYGSWSSIGYTQMQHGLLTPLASWVGVAGVSFATLWIASVASWLLMTTVPVRRRLISVTVWAVSMALALVVANAPPAGQTPGQEALTVAAITPSHEATRDLDQAVLAARRAGEWDAATLNRIGALAGTINDELLTRSRDAARTGARLIVWSETAGRVLAADEERLIARGQALAVEEDVYLFMGLGVWRPGERPPLENKVIAIEPSGQVAWHNRKARPIVGSEAPFLPPGHDELPTLDTPFGRIGLVICHDLDFADYVAQASHKEVALMLTPSADWSVIADLHAKMGIMRAVENGFWLLRPAYAGLSVIASPRGRVTVSAYDDELEERVLTGRIPVSRTDTLYPHVRTILPWLAAALLIAVLLVRGIGSGRTQAAQDVGMDGAA